MKNFLALTVLASTPFLAFAQGNNAEGVLSKFSRLIDLATPIVFALALLFFFWGLATFILKSGEDQAAGKQRMIWGLVALFVMFSVWGILSFAQDSLGLKGETGALTIPSIPR